MNRRRTELNVGAVSFVSVRQKQKTRRSLATCSGSRKRQLSLNSVVPGKGLEPSRP